MYSPSALFWRAVRSLKGGTTVNLTVWSSQWKELLSRAARMGGRHDERRQKTAKKKPTSPSETDSESSVAGQKIAALWKQYAERAVAS
jgi:hypothetical protein